MEYQYSELTGKIIGAAMEVHRELGCGFMESVYQRSLAIELNKQNIIFAREVAMPVFYKEIEVGGRKVDFLVNESICVELKAITTLEDVHLAQALNYLEAFNLEVGLLINFGAESLQTKRLYNKRFKPGT